MSTESRTPGEEHMRTMLEKDQLAHEAIDEAKVAQKEADDAEGVIELKDEDLLVDVIEDPATAGKIEGDLGELDAEMEAKKAENARAEEAERQQDQALLGDLEMADAKKAVEAAYEPVTDDMIVKEDEDEEEPEMKKAA